MPTTIAAAGDDNGNKFTVDTGATVHCVNDRTVLEHEYERPRRMKIQMANGQILRPEAVGSCRVKLLTETGSVREVVLHGVVYHREFSENLLSIRRLAVDSGFKGSFGPDELDNYLMHKKSGDIIRFQYTDALAERMWAYSSGLSGDTLRRVRSERQHRRCSVCTMLCVLVGCSTGLPAWQGPRGGPRE